MKFNETHVYTEFLLTAEKTIPHPLDMEHRSLLAWSLMLLLFLFYQPESSHAKHYKRYTCEISASTGCLLIALVCF